jgi:flagellar operon protein
MLKIAAYQNVNLPEKVQRPAVTPSKPNGRSLPATGADFKTALNAVLEKTAGVQFSAHAKARLHSRGVELNQDKLDALSRAIDKAEAKGARESLVLSDEAAYVVSVKNRTVITAFDRDNLRDGVFTAIDSAVIL